MDIRRIGAGNVAAVVAASPLFDGPATARISQRFLDSEGHFLLIAYEDGAPVGFVSGVEMTHPDKGLEMFLYELAVDEALAGAASARHSSLHCRTSRSRDGCYGMWVLTDADNEAALATYRSTATTDESTHVMLTWTFAPDSP